MTDVFVSYAREDRETAGRIVDFLERHELDVWWDRDIHHGRYRTAISAALEAAGCVVVLWSSFSVESDYVLDEAGEGKERDILVSFSLDEAELPHGFRQVQCIDSHDADALDRLLLAVRAVLGQPTAADRPGTAGNQESLASALEAHARWLELSEGGVRFVREGEDLRSLDFGGGSLRGSVLTDCDLRSAKGLKAEALARARLTDTRLPDGMESRWQEALDSIRTADRWLTSLVLALVTAAGFTMTLCLLGDGELLFGGMRPWTDEPGFQFTPRQALWIASSGLFAVFLFVQYVLSSVLRECSELPDAFPSGRRLARSVSVWLLRPFLERSIEPDDSDFRGQLSSVSGWVRRLLSFAVWGLAPLTLLLAWRRTLPLHDRLLSPVLVVLTMLSVFVAVRLARNAAALHLARKPRLDRTVRPATVSAALAGGVLALLTVGVLAGERSYREYSVPESCAPHGWRGWVPGLASALPRGFFRATARVEKWRDAEGADFELGSTEGKCDTPRERRSFDLRYALITDTQLGGRDFSGSDWSCAVTDDLDLRGALFCGRRSRLDGALLVNGQLTGANFTDAQLTAVDLRGSVLDGARLVRADLRKANLQYASFVGADLSGARLDGADVQGADLSRAIFTDARLDGVNLEQASLAGADFRRVEGLNCTARQALCTRGAKFLWDDEQGCPRPVECSE